MKNLVKSKAWKNFMAKLYGWGAAVVIVGALFKIEHFPGASIMLIVGLGIEALIFFFSAFEPPHAEPDWTLVYPELAGIDPIDGISGRDRDNAVRGIGGGASGPGITNISLSSNLDKLLEEANIGPELIENLSKGLKNLSDNASKLADVTNAGVVTDKFLKNIEGASSSVVELSQSYKNKSEMLKHDLSLSQEYASAMGNTVASLKDLSDTYSKTAESVKGNLGASEAYTESVKKITGFTSQLGENYAKSAEMLSKTVEALQVQTQQGNEYATQVQKTVQNLAALNDVYYLQLQATNQQYQVSDKLQGSLNTLLDNMTQSATQSEKYREELSALTRNISALNNVYGNMLSAMNVNISK